MEFIKIDKTVQTTVNNTMIDAVTNIDQPKYSNTTRVEDHKKLTTRT